MQRGAPIRRGSPGRGGGLRSRPVADRTLLPSLSPGEVGAGREVETGLPVVTGTLELGLRPRVRVPCRRSIAREHSEERHRSPVSVSVSSVVGRKDPGSSSVAGRKDPAGSSVSVSVRESGFAQPDPGFQPRRQAPLPEAAFGSARQQERYEEERLFMTQQTPTMFVEPQVSPEDWVKRLGPPPADLLRTWLTAYAPSQMGRSRRSPSRERSSSPPPKKKSVREKSVRSVVHQRSPSVSSSESHQDDPPVRLEASDKDFLEEPMEQEPIVTPTPMAQD